MYRSFVCFIIVRTQAEVICSYIFNQEYTNPVSVSSFLLFIKLLSLCMQKLTGVLQNLTECLNF